MSSSTIPAGIDDPVNIAILSVAEDKLAGFLRDPFGEVARRTGLPLATVLERVRAMLTAGTIRRVRQTMMSTNLAHGALVAWQVPEERLHEAFDFMFQHDPFSGHVVIRTTDGVTAGSAYRLWTTLKVPRRLRYGAPLRVAGGAHRRAELAADAGQAAVRARCRPHAPPRSGAGQPLR